MEAVERAGVVLLLSAEVVFSMFNGIEKNKNNFVLIYFYYYLFIILFKGVITLGAFLEHTPGILRAQGHRTLFSYYKHVFYNNVNCKTSKKNN